MLLYYGTGITDLRIHMWKTLQTSIRVGNAFAKLAEKRKISGLSNKYGKNGK